VTEGPFRVVIPARFESTRLPGKVLRPIVGKPMIQHVWERARESGARDIVIATDNEEVVNAARSFGAQVCMTSETCNSGTDRVAQICRLFNWHDDIPVVNVQGDAPLMPPASIRRVAQLLQHDPEAELSTLCVPINSEQEYLDPNVVKVVFNDKGRALYFSRAPIPAGGHGTESAWESAWRHLGLYAYRASALQRLSSTEPCQLEQVERLEQLRAMWLGMGISIAVDEESHGPDVDIESDLRKVEELMASRLGAQVAAIEDSQINYKLTMPLTDADASDAAYSLESEVPYNLGAPLVYSLESPTPFSLEPPVVANEENAAGDKAAAVDSEDSSSETVEQEPTTSQKLQPSATGFQQPVSILFVCMGNICRSPTAEGVMRSIVEAAGESRSVRLDSAGTHAYHEGEPPDPRAARAASRRGINISNQKARAVQPADFHAFDYILAMDEDNLALLEKMRPDNSRAQLELFLNYSKATQASSIPDPYYGGSTGFERVLDMLVEAGRGLMEHLQRRG
jgi:3-deoxy-manno-octulosonate cytidylyltransferase (CMP-KDO synthetase)